MTRVAPTVLFLHNEHLATEALLGEAFSDAGYDVATFTVVPAERIDAPAHEVTFPDPADYDVIVPLGARWPVYDEALRATWVGAEMQMMRDAADAGVALLGICFGGQLLAQTFGGTVGRSTAPEIGWYDIATDRPDLVPPGPWFQWHFDRFTVPPGAVEIARTPNAPQAFVLGRALALQFHPELDHRVLADWLGDDRDGDVVRFGLDHDELMYRTRQLEDDARRRVRLLVSGFLSYAAAAPCPS
ncbi:glutamine amidotransferase [Mycobacterium sp. 852013-51886_SCH5428379]|uniref:type 1 glutamine amidotransferase n=1 Tax=Mycobacterium sp. 852013-51886_SCH5428379 TaxID=1834111 RepID=UPI000801E407|nr:glutamine amidotransferase [Mycobacterium sp. 852013-51886_SCH5428379]OBB59337.1 glutamine amidotransferase [Mycobacterium sp. 852013-51886_SCH5428379]